MHGAQRRALRMLPEVRNMQLHPLAPNPQPSELVGLRRCTACNPGHHCEMRWWLSWVLGTCLPGLQQARGLWHWYPAPRTCHPELTLTVRGLSQPHDQTSCPIIKGDAHFTSAIISIVQVTVVRSRAHVQEQAPESVELAAACLSPSRTGVYSAAGRPVKAVEDARMPAARTGLEPRVLPSAAASIRCSPDDVACRAAWLCMPHTASQMRSSWTVSGIYTGRKVRDCSPCIFEHKHVDAIGLLLVAGS